MNAFKNNVKALLSEDKPLADAMTKMQSFKNFNFIKTQDDNLLNSLSKTPLYQNPNLEVEEKIKYFDENFPKHPVLFIFGLGNARLIHHLLKNAKHKRIIVFEPEFELVYYGLENFDFAKDIKAGRLVILDVLNLNESTFSALFSLAYMGANLKVYNLNSSCEYYEKFYEQDMQSVHKACMVGIFTQFARCGNDPYDAFIGFVNTTQNLPKMLKNPSLKELIAKRKKKAKNAIIVSTGPSLNKQLPLLKEYAGKASIFCADSAYPILYKHGIKPDYVLSTERIDWTSKLFDNDFGEFDEGILFVLSNFTHKDTIKNLEKNSRAYMVVFQEISHQNLFKLHDYGYLADKVGVAIFCFNLAVRLEHENIIFIGQDLAYAKDGLSHSEDYSLLYSHEGEYERDKGKCLIPAYGGEGVVESSPTWILFKQDLELDITKANMSKGIKTYNCTGGGL